MSKEIKQVIVMRNDLNMRKGKMVAQGAHASIAFLIDCVLGDSGPRSIETKWMIQGQTKICVRVDSEAQLLEIEAKARAANLTAYVITDAGHTEFGGVPTKTCLAIGPDYADEVDKITGTLKLL
jgi:PTH2 family peptidyl-tRNA hydrolase